MSAGANRAQKTGIAYEVEKKQEHVGITKHDPNLLT